MSAIPAAIDPRNSTIGRAIVRPPLALRALRGGLGALSRVAPERAAAIAERMFLTPQRHARPSAEVEALATAEPRPLSSPRGVLRAWEWPPVNEPRGLVEERRDGAPRVLLVHGWEGRGSQLGPLARALVGRGIRVFTFDAPGHGESGGRASSVFHFADAVEAAAASFGPLAAIVTHSMGGAGTLWASRRGALASRLVMIAPPVDLRDFTRVFARTVGISEEVRILLHARLERRFGVRLEDARLVARVAALDTPVLVVHDEDDREVPIACGAALAEAAPRGELVRTRGLGHRRILRDEQAIERVARFVASGA